MSITKPLFYYSVMTPNRGDKAIRKSITNAISEQLPDISYAFFNLKYDELTEDRIVRQLNKDSSGLMIAGSGLYSNANTSSGWYFPADIGLFNKIRVPIFLVGLGTNNNLKNDIFGELTDKAKNSIRAINKLASVSTVRDIRTYHLLKNLGINKHQVMLDPANFLKVNYQEKRKRVAINMCQHAPSLGRFDCDLEGLIQRRKNLEMFVDTCKYLRKKGYELVFIAHDALEHSLYRDLKECVSEISLLNTDNIDVMLEEYSQCSFTIGMKMHSCIMSLSSGTPFIHPYYDIKSEEYLRLLGMEWAGQPIYKIPPGWLIDRVDILEKELKSTTEEVKNIKEKNYSEFKDMVTKICSTIRTTS